MKRYLPPQHGAWAFLGLPLLLGASVMDWTPLVLVLAVAWVAAYPLSYAALGLVRSPHPDRFRRPFVVWLVVVGPAGLALAVARPWLVWVGVGYLALFAVNLGYARRHDERALLNDLVFVLECSVMVPVTAALGDATGSGWSPAVLLDVPASAWVLTALCALVLTGSTLQVKSLIRERRDRRYAYAAQAFAVGSVPVAVALAWITGWPRSLWIVVPLVVLAVRAFALPGRDLPPARIGLVELGAFVVTALCGALAFP